MIHPHLVLVSRRQFLLAAGSAATARIAGNGCRNRLSLWSPDGQWLLFQGCQFRSDPGHDWSDVCIARPRGSDFRVLTEGQAMWFAVTSGYPQNRGGGSNVPAWTPDGQILFPRRSPGAKVPWEFQANRPDTDIVPAYRRFLVDNAAAPPNAPDTGGIPKASTEANVPIEISFTAVQLHREPFLQVTLDVVFTDPAGMPRTVPAFWAGGNQWKVRYSSPSAGSRTRT